MLIHLQKYSTRVSPRSPRRQIWIESFWQFFWILTLILRNYPLQSEYLRGYTGIVLSVRSYIRVCTKYQSTTPTVLLQLYLLCTYPVIPSFVHVCIYFWFPLWLFLELDFLLWNIVLEVSGPFYNLITRNYATNFNMNFLEVSLLL